MSNLRVPGGAVFCDDVTVMLPQSDLSASSTSVKMHPYMLWVPDHIDEGALARRLAVRQQHIVGVNKTAKQGVLKAAGALLAPGSEGAEPQDRKFAGSMLIYEAESLEDARRLAEADVYWKGNVVSDSRCCDSSITLTACWEVGQRENGHSSAPHGDYPP